MNETKDDRTTVYEIGYLLVTSVPEEKIPAEAEALKKIIASAGAEIIADSAPHRQRLEYTMRVKTVSGAYEKYDEAYFGWVKFELGSGSVEEVKKSIEKLPSVLRMLLITTIRENTYLGKLAPGLSPAPKAGGPDAAAPAEAKKEPVKEAVAAPASIEEMDKSIEALVKEA